MQHSLAVDTTCILTPEKLYHFNHFKTEFHPLSSLVYNWPGRSGWIALTMQTP